MSIRITSIGKDYILKPIKKEVANVSTAFNAGRRLAKINNQSTAKGLANGVLKVYRRVGAFPLLTGVTLFSTVPVPGATMTGIILGMSLKKGAKAVMKALKQIK